MEAATVGRDRRRSRSNVNDSQGWDQELRAAKKRDAVVDLVLTNDFATPNDGVMEADETHEVKIVWVDRYSIKLQWVKNNSEFWIAKSYIAGAWIR